MNFAPRLTLALIATACSTTGLRAADPFPQWTFYGPLPSMTTTLLDLNGDVVHAWPAAFTPGASLYLIDDGAILRTSNDASLADFGGPGRGGRLQRIAWDGTLEWNYVAAGPDFVQHHDIRQLPNGNLLVIVWERKTAAEAIAAGRNPDNLTDQLWSEGILEIQPDGATGGTVVWEWHVWDHLVQDFDADLPGFGDPADHPGRININYPFGSSDPDWLHANAIDYNAELDQILLSAERFDEIWVISHDPADSGELLYRWGNPEAYGRGTPADKILEGQHNPHWIPPGLEGAGNLLVFNNGAERGFSSLDEITPPLLPDGTYTLDPIAPYGPTDLTWTCDERDGSSFFAPIMSSVQRLPNGNHLMCLGPAGDFFELDEDCNTVWQHDSGAQPVFRAHRVGEQDARLEGLLWAAGDTNGDLIVNVADIITVITQWGTAGPEGDVAPIPGGDGVVDINDLILLILEWGS